MFGNDGSRFNPGDVGDWTSSSSSDSVPDDKGSFLNDPLWSVKRRDRVDDRVDEDDVVEELSRLPVDVKCIEFWLLFRCRAKDIVYLALSCSLTLADGTDMAAGGSRSNGDRLDTLGTEVEGRGA